MNVYIFWLHDNHLVCPGIFRYLPYYTLWIIINKHLKNKLEIGAEIQLRTNLQLRTHVFFNQQSLGQSLKIVSVEVFFGCIFSYVFVDLQGIDLSHLCQFKKVLGIILS